MEFSGCWECGEALPEGRRKRKFCSKACSTRFNGRKWPGLSQTDRERVGRAAEMLVASDLLKRYEDVLLSSNPHGTIDLVVVVDNKPLKVEVKVGHLTQKGLLCADTGYGKERRRGRQESDMVRAKRFDVLAVALLEHNEVIYHPELENWGKEKDSLVWRQRAMDYTGTPNRRVIPERTWVNDGKLHIEFEEDGMSLEIKLKHFPQLVQLSEDEAKKMVPRNGYWVRWPRLNFEIDVTDFIRAEPSRVKGRRRDVEGGSQRARGNDVRADAA